MKIEFAWGDRVISKDGTPAVVYSCGMNPSQTDVVVGVHNRIFIYSCKSGQLLNSVRGHKEQINCVRYSSCGERFATGSDDTNVVVWTKAGVGILKYTHGSTVTSLGFCPVSNRLASGGEHDIAIWSPIHSTVNKVKIHNRCISMDWSSDGMYLVTGHADGTVWLRDQKAQELASIKREQAVHALSFLHESDTASMSLYPLCVTAWDGSMQIYSIQANALKPMHPSVSLGFDVCSILAIPDGMLVGGSDQRVSLYSNAGKFLKVLTRHSDWVWQICGTKDLFAAVINSAELMCFRGLNQMVHAAFSDVYAQRYQLTDVNIQRLVGENITIKLGTREYVSKLALYRHRLAVQLPDRIQIYYGCNGDGTFLEDFVPFKSSTSPDAPCTQYKLRYKITKLVNPAEQNKENVYCPGYTPPLPGSRVLGSGPKKGIQMLYPDHQIHPSIENQALACSSEHLILMNDRKLIVSTFSGEISHIWRLDAMPRFLKVVGGAPGKECIILALKDGSILQYQMTATSQYPTLLYKMETVPRCVDINCSRDKLAVVDTQGTLSVVDLFSQSVIYTDKNVSSAVFNNIHKDMLCYSTASFLVVKTGTFAPTRYPCVGVATAFVGGRAFTLTSSGKLNSHDVHLSSAVQEYLSKGLSTEALRVANLGVSDFEWRVLGLRALLQQDFSTSQQAFAKVRDTKALSLVHRLSLSAKQNNVSNAMSAGDVCAHFQWYDQAAALYLLGGTPKKALEMFLMLKQWKLARKVSEKIGDKQYARDLLLQQAQWLEEQGDISGAADILWESGQLEAAMVLWIKGNNLSEAKTRLSEYITLVETNSVRLEKEALSACASMIAKAGEIRLAVRAYLAVKDKDSAVVLLVAESDWTEALALLDDHINRFGKDVVAQRLAELILVPYAEYLAAHGQYEEAHKTYLRAGRHAEATALMTKLVHGAIDTGRLLDAAYLYYLIQANCIQRLNTSVFPTESLRGLARLATAVVQRQAEWTETQSKLYQCAAVIDACYTHDPMHKDPFLGFYASQRYLAILQQRTATPAHTPFMFGTEKGVFHSAFSSTLAPALTSFTTAYETPENSISGHPSSAATNPTQYEAPRGTSVLTALLVFARACTQLHAYKTARQTYAKALQLQLEAGLRSQIDAEIFALKSFPFSDNDTLVKFACMRCQKPIPLLNPTGDCCSMCGTPVQRCSVTHKPLPVVEFTIKGSVSTQDALKALHSDPLVIKTPPLLHPRASELLTKPIFSPEVDEKGASFPIRYGIEELSIMPAHWVFCCNPTNGEFKPRWFLRLVEEVNVYMCYSCGCMMQQEEAETHAYQHGNCAVCRTNIKPGSI